MLDPQRHVFFNKYNFFVYFFAIFIFVKPSETASKKDHPVHAKQVSLLFVLSVATINHLVDLKQIVHIPEK